MGYSRWAQRGRSGRHAWQKPRPVLTPRLCKLVLTPPPVRRGFLGPCPSPGPLPPRSPSFTLEPPDMLEAACSFRIAPAAPMLFLPLPLAPAPAPPLAPAPAWVVAPAWVPYGNALCLCLLLPQFLCPCCHQPFTNSFAPDCYVITRLAPT